MNNQGSRKEPVNLLPFQPDSRSPCTLPLLDPARLAEKLKQNPITKDIKSITKVPPVQTATKDVNGKDVLLFLHSGVQTMTFVGTRNWGFTGADARKEIEKRLKNKGKLRTIQIS